MTKEEFYSIIGHNESPSEEQVSMIKLLINQYPYFSVPYILLAKKFKDNDSLRDISLRLAAVHVPNRSRLKQIINNENNDLLEEKKNNPPLNYHEPKVMIEGKSDEIDPSQPDLARESSILSSNIISENLAKILTKQGKIEEAKEIYKKLILKFPEKSSYFADMIKAND